MSTQGLQRPLVLVTLILCAIGGCGGDGGGDSGGGETDYADGSCVDRTQPAPPDPTDPAASSFPLIVDCESPEARGVLREVENFEQDCPPGQGFEFGELAVEDESASNEAFCIEPL